MCLTKHPSHCFAWACSPAFACTSPLSVPLPDPSACSSVILCLHPWKFSSSCSAAPSGHWWFRAYYWEIMALLVGMLFSTQKLMYSIMQADMELVSSSWASQSASYSLASAGSHSGFCDHLEQMLWNDFLKQQPAICAALLFPKVRESGTGICTLNENYIKDA